MKIYECCPFNNENLVTKVKILEDQNWIDELHITESNKNFHYKNKDYNFDIQGYNIVKYHKFDATNEFLENNIIGKFKGFKYRLSNDTYKKNVLKSPTWYNEAVQRNKSSFWIKEKLEDNDIIILSDIDEIIDSRCIDRIVEETKKRGIITFKIHFTLFYFNLFSSNWGGAPDYSYRIFVMTGKYFKNMNITSDKLRKFGEQNKLSNEIYCINEFLGFHHSWLGDENFILNKLNSYAHTEHERFRDISYIKKCLLEKKSIFPGHELFINNDVDMLRSITILKDNELKNYFV